MIRKLITKIRLQNKTHQNNKVESTQGDRCQLEGKDDEAGCPGAHLWFSAAEEAAQRRGPDRAGGLNSLQTADDVECEVDEDHHGDHDKEVLEERDEGYGGGRKEDGEGDEEVSHGGQLEQEDVESVGMVRPGPVVEAVEGEEREEEGEGSVDHHHGPAKYLSQQGGANVLLRQVTAPLHQD